MTTKTALKSLILAGGLALGIGATTIPTSAASISEARAAMVATHSTNPVHTPSQVRNLHPQASLLGWICPPLVYMGGVQSTTYYHPICPFQGQRHIAVLSRNSIVTYAAGRLLVSGPRLEDTGSRTGTVLGTWTVRMTAE